MSVVSRDGSRAYGYDDVMATRRITDEGLLRARSLQMLRMKRLGMKIEKIAEYFRCSERLVYSSLAAIPSEAKRRALGLDLDLEELRPDGPRARAFHDDARPKSLADR